MPKGLGRWLVWACVLASVGGCGGGGGASTSPPPPAALGFSAHLERTTISLSATPSDSTPALTQWVSVQFTGTLPARFCATLSPSYQGLAMAELTGREAGDTSVMVRVKPAGALPNGVYTDTLKVRVFGDEQCTQEIVGSPLSLAVQYTVTGSGAQLAPTNVAIPPHSALAHDVVDAAFSKPLNAIVMVAATPSPALVVYDVSTRQERSFALPHVPTALSLSADGLQAGIGHNAGVTLTDLSTWATNGAPQMQEVPTRAQVYRLALDGLHHLQIAGNPDPYLHTVDLATGAETETFYFYQKPNIRLHPAGRVLFGVDPQVSPERIMQIPLDQATFPYVMGYTPPHPVCGDLWFSEDGQRLFTACGYVYGVDVDPHVPWSDLGRLALSSPVSETSEHGPQIAGLSHSAAARQIALIDNGVCGAAGATGCDGLLTVLDDASGKPRSSYWVEPTREGSYFRTQSLRFVFHDAQGGLWLIAQPSGVLDEQLPTYLFPLGSTNTGL